MSRWLTAGAESQIVDSEEFLSIGAGAVGFNTSGVVVRPGGSTSCFNCNSSAANYLSSFILGSIGTTWYLRMPFRIGNASLPSTALQIVRVMDTGTTQKIAARVSTTGSVQIIDTSGTLLDTYASIVSNHWYTLQLAWVDNSSGNSGWSWRLYDDVTHLLLASGLGTAAITNNPTADCRMGHITAGDTASSVQMDDIAINATGGTEDLSFPDWRGVIIHGLPISDNTVGTGWLTSAGGSTSLFEDVNNTPPTGVAATPTTGQTQIKNANSTAGTLSYTANVQSYTTMGVPSGATINRVRSCYRCAGSDVTGTNNAIIRMASNPDDGSNTTASAAFDTVAAADTGANQGWLTFTTPWNITPTVTRGTQPTIRVGKNSASTRVAMVDQMFVQVEFVPTSVDGTAATLVWDTPAAVNAAADSLKWDLNKAIDSAAESLLWDLTVPVNSAAESLLWDLTAVVNAVADSIKWDLFGFVGQTCTLDWDMGELVNGNTSMLKWDLNGAVNEDQTLIWDLIAQINSDAETFKWDLPVPIDALVESLIWDYPGVANGNPVSLLWDLVAALNQELTLVWDLPVLGPESALTILWRLWGPQGRLRWMDSEIDLESKIKLER